MSDKIRELAFKAGDGLLQYDETGFILSENEVERFTELIVNECIDFCSSNLSKTVGQALKLHFGMKEHMAGPEQCSYPKCQATNGCIGACSKTEPLKREWVGLTDEEVVFINDQHYNIAYRDFDADVAIARAIEAKLKEKNT